MAFTRIETCEPAAAPRTPATVGQQGTSRSFRRALAMITIILVHALLLLLLITRGTVGTHGHATSGSSSGALTVAAVHEVTAAPPATAAAVTPPAVPAPAAPTEAVPPAPAVEWMSTTVKVATATATPAASPASATAAVAYSGIASADAAAGGAGDYDPYAGSAPLRRDSAMSNVFAPGSAALGAGSGVAAPPIQRIDLAVLERARLAAGARGVRGHFTLTVQIDGEGVVKALVGGWDGVPGNQRALSAVFIGIRLFRDMQGTSAAIIITLPPIDIVPR